MAAGGSGKAVLAAFFGNSAVAVTKFIAFLLTRSSSMLAESVHSVADAGNQALLPLGARQSRKAADGEHQFGFGRERYFWSFVVAMVLFVLGSAFAVHHGIEKILHPHPIDNFGVALIVLGLGLIIEAFAFVTAVREARPREMVRIREAIVNTPQVRELVHLRTPHLSPEELLSEPRSCSTRTSRLNSWPMR